MLKPTDTFAQLAAHYNSLSTSAVYLSPEEEHSLKLDLPLKRVADQIVLEAEGIEALPTPTTYLCNKSPIQRIEGYRSPPLIDDHLSAFLTQLETIAPPQSPSIVVLSRRLDEIEALITVGVNAADELELLLDTLS